MAHSTKSYSDDLRWRVVKARLSGKSVSQIVALYDVDDNNVYRWTARYEATGSVSCRRHDNAGRKSKIEDMGKFEAFARAHAHSTLAQMQAHWERLAPAEAGVSLMCLSRALKRLGWTRKKSSIPTANATKRSGKRS